MPDSEDGDGAPQERQGRSVHMEAHVPPGGIVYQAGRDQHIYQDGGQRVHASPEAASAECPYPGLAPFGPEQAEWFFGRERTVAAICRRLDDQVRDGGLLIVLGPSGTGKSSLLRAGVLPAVTAGRLPAAGSSRWPQVVVTPTEHPLSALAAPIAQAGGSSVEELVAAWAADPGRCVEDYRRLPPRGGGVRPEAAGGRVVLVVDQFEEVFTLCPDEQERRASIEILGRLAAASTVGDGPAAVVILSVRSDFHGACMSYPPLLAALPSAVLVEPMSSDELREAIVRPARMVGLEVGPGLVEVLLTDLGSHVDAAGSPATVDPSRVGRLPLLAHALRATWQTRDGHLLTVDGYRTAGGIHQAVATTAEHLFAELSPDGRQLARTVFIRLVKIGRHSDDARLHADPDELIRSLPDPQSAERVLDIFTRGRLLTRDQHTVTLIHDALLRAWPRLRAWIEEDRAGHLLRQDLDDTAASWEQADQDTALLYRGSRLEAAAAWADRHPDDLGGTARGFLVASRRQQRRGERTRQAVTAALVAFLLTAIAVGFIARDEARTAQRNEATAQAQHAIALSRQLAAQALTVDQTDPYTARQLAVAAWSESPTPQAAATLATLLTEQEQHSLLIGHQGEVKSVAFNPTGTMLASAGDWTVRLWDPVSGTEIGVPLTQPDSALMDAVAFNPAGTELATLDDGGAIQLWNPQTQQRIGSPLTANPAPRYGLINTALAFDPAGTLLASAYGTGVVRLWDPTTGRQLAALAATTPDMQVTAVAFNPSGTILATGSEDGLVRLWDPATGHQIGAPITATGNSVTALAFDPDGTKLATADNGGAATGGGTVKLWDPATGRQIGTPLLADPSGGVSNVAFNPSGTLLAASTAVGVIRVWNPTTGQDTGTSIIATANGWVSAVAFNPNGTILASGGEDGTVRLWNPTAGQPSGTPLEAASYGYQGTAVAFNPSGTILASGDSHGTLRLWDPATGRPIHDPITATIGGYGINELVFNHSGTLLATAGDDGAVRLWDPATGRQLGSPFGIPHSTGGGFYEATAVAFNPNDTVLAVGTADGMVHLWDPTTGRQLGPPITANTVNTPGDYNPVPRVAFNPAGTILATLGGGTLRLWNPDTRQEIGPPIRDASPPDYGDTPSSSYNRSVDHATDMAFDHDGTTVAIAYNSGIVTRYDPTAGREVGAPMVGHPGSGFVPTMVTADPAASVLATAAPNTTVRLWDSTTSQDIGVPMTAAPAGAVAMMAFNSTGTVLATVTHDGWVRLWPTTQWLDPYHTLCNETGHALNIVQWSTYAPNEPLPTTCN